MKIYFFFFFFCLAHSMLKFPGPGLSRAPSSGQNLSSDDAGSLTAAPAGSSVESSFGGGGRGEA